MFCGGGWLRQAWIQESTLDPPYWPGVRSRCSRSVSTNRTTEPLGGCMYSVIPWQSSLIITNIGPLAHRGEFQELGLSELGSSDNPTLFQYMTIFSTVMSPLIAAPLIIAVP